ncbi:hypothetical protein JJD84_11305 [Pseudomonas fluorescens]|nr:hypothetical protein [Pseudomonas fluorescens]
MEGMLLVLSLVIWAVAWFLVVRKRGKLSLVAGNLVGAIVGIVVATVVLAVIAPEPTEEQKQAQATIDRDRAYAKVQTLATKRAIENAAVKEAPGAAVDQITSLYLKHKVYADNSVLCRPKVIGNRSFVCCVGQGPAGTSAPQVWEYVAGKFKSINGPASSKASTTFSNESLVEESALPLPDDIDVSAIVEQFSKS